MPAGTRARRNIFNYRHVQQPCTRFTAWLPIQHSPNRAHRCSPLPPKRPLDGYSRWQNLKTFVPLSRESIRLREIAGRFPRRVQLGSQRCT
ncbi:hypothetical protein DF045_23045 [Burkholderia cepacia]|nr:hypothetical protein DF045_23045 [Burkholderia cepacia]